MTKEELLKELSQETYVALKPSAINGIGVFAIADIPKGCRDLFSKNAGKWLTVSISDVEKLPEHSRSLIETYCLYDEQHYFIPDHGFKVMDLVSYLNHSPTPNIISINDGEYFEALVDISAGNELLINYKDIADVGEYE